MGADLPRTIPANLPNHQRPGTGDLLEQFLKPTRNPNIAAKSSAHPRLSEHRRGLESEPALTRQRKRLKCVNAVAARGEKGPGAAALTRRGARRADAAKSVAARRRRSYVAPL
ncbi:MAG: hypothetical protein ABSF67_22735 [Roseiarcus sp.]